MTMFKGWKTILWNVANSVLLAIEAANTTYGIPEGYDTVWIGVFIVGNIVLRLLTTTPVGVR